MERQSWPQQYQPRIYFPNQRPICTTIKLFFCFNLKSQSIGIRHSFNLLDYYFRSDPRSFHTLINYQDNMSTELKAQLSRLAERVSQKIKTQISKERIRLLQIIYRLLSLSKFLKLFLSYSFFNITIISWHFNIRNIYTAIIFQQRSSRWSTTRKRRGLPVSWTTFYIKTTTCKFFGVISTCSVPAQSQITCQVTRKWTYGLKTLSMRNTCY